MTSAYMPDVVVEIAFDSGYSTPIASRTWTDVSDYLEASHRIDIGFGRGDEFATADANTLKIVLDNSDGRFTPEKTSGAYYPDVRVGRPIRVTSTRVGGSASTRFVGYVDGWVMSSAGANPTVTVTATSQIARLGLASTFGGSLETSWASLFSLFKLNEAAAPAVDSTTFFPNLNTVGGTVTWRTGVGPAGEGTAVSLGANGSLSSSVGGVSRQLPGSVVFEFFFRVDGIDDTDFLLVYVGTPSTRPSVMVLRDVGDIRIQGLIFGVACNATILLDSELHHVALSHDGATLSLYVDGIVIDTAAASGTPEIATFVDVSRTGTAGTIDLSYIGLSADVAGIAERAFIGTTPLIEGTASERLTSYADHVGVESTDFDTTTETLTAYSIAGKTMLESMRAAELSDGGVLFDSAAGALTYNERASRYAATSAFTLDAATQQIEASVVPKLDRSGLVNEAVVTQTDVEGVLARYLDQDSIDDYGIARQAWEIQGAYDACLQAAAWAVFIHGEPETRIPSLDVDLLPLSAALQDALLAATIGTRFTVTGLPAEFASSSLDFFVEGYTESIGPESYTFSLNVSKRDAAKWDVWTVEDSVLGQYDAYPIAW